MHRRPRAAAPGGWFAASAVVALLVLAPIVALAITASSVSAALWSDLVAFVLPSALRETAILLVGVGLLAVAIGTMTAWLVAAYEFPGRRLVDWALLLPLAVPTYIIAFAYLDLLHPVGPVQTAIRALLGIDSPRDFRLPDVRSMTGCVILLGFVLYPYVYLTTRAMFFMQSANLIDVARTLGLGRRATFLRVALPLARPAIAVGLTLALLEAVNDIGAAEFLGVRTLTVSVYTTWVTRSDLPGAAQIALAMVIVALALLWVERYARRRRRYANDAQNPRPLTRQRLSGASGMAALAVTLVPIAVGFLFPVAYLVVETLERVRFAGVPAVVLRETVTTVTLAAVATAITVSAGLVVAYAARIGGRAAALASNIASIGYALPGTVLALGVLPVVTGIEGLFDAGVFLIGSGAALVYAYGARFMALAAGSVEAGFSRLSPSLDAAARTLGLGPMARLWRLHLPLLRPALGTAALLVFVDVMKELPATLLLRPIGVETLATHLYGEAVRGTYEDAAIAALLIVAAGLAPVVLLARISRTSSGADQLL